jgi:hypothetical protein
MWGRGEIFWAAALCCSAPREGEPRGRGRRKFGGRLVKLMRLGLSFLNPSFGVCRTVSVCIFDGEFWHQAFTCNSRKLTAKDFLFQESLFLVHLIIFGLTAVQNQNRTSSSCEYQMTMCPKVDLQQLVDKQILFLLKKVVPFA